MPLVIHANEWSIVLMEIAITIVQLICSIILILTVLFQSGSKQGLGAIDGISESFSKGNSKDIDGKLRVLTVIVGILFVVTTVALNVISLSK